MDIEIAKSLKKMSSQVVQSMSEVEIDNEKCQCPLLVDKFGQFFREFDHTFDKILTALVNSTPISLDAIKDSVNVTSSSITDTDERGSNATMKAIEYPSEADQSLKEVSSRANKIVKMDEASDEKTIKAVENNTAESAKKSFETANIQKTNEQIGLQTEPVTNQHKVNDTTERNCAPKKSPPLKRKAKTPSGRESHLKRRHSIHCSASPNKSVIKCEGVQKMNISVELERNSARKMRRKTLDFRVSFASRLEETIVYDRNTNKNVCFTETDSCCIYCEKKVKNLINHYITMHPDYELPIARPSPIMAFRLRQQLECFKKSGSSISGFCFLCERKKTCTKYGWESHLLNHTGEQHFHCEKCNTELKTRNQHTNCSGKLIKTFEANALDGSLMCYMCKDCNHMAVNRARMIKHQVIEHENLGDESYFEKLTLVPNLSPLNYNIPHGYIDDATCFKCTICDTQTNNDAEFTAHFDEKHGNEKSYQCCCGEEITIDGHNLLGSYVVVHLLQHSADLYTCMVCKESESFYKSLHFNQADIQDHLLNEHPDRKFCFQHAHREPNGKTIITETSMKLNQCAVCKLQIDGFLVDVENHFEMAHQSQTITMKTLMLKKSMDHQTQQVSSHPGSYWSFKIETSH